MVEFRHYAIKAVPAGVSRAYVEVPVQAPPPPPHGRFISDSPLRGRLSRGSVLYQCPMLFLPAWHHPCTSLASTVWRFRGCWQGKASVEAPGA
jgi:hypothetical protein